jgi:hypothetical protein
MEPNELMMCMCAVASLLSLSLSLLASCIYSCVTHLSSVCLCFFRAFFFFCLFLFIADSRGLSRSRKMTKDGLDNYYY